MVNKGKPHHSFVYTLYVAPPDSKNRRQALQTVLH
jgi:hypothetical protein